jgi:hypothetical protein
VCVYGVREKHRGHHSVNSSVIYRPKEPRVRSSLCIYIYIYIYDSECRRPAHPVYTHIYTHRGIHIVRCYMVVSASVCRTIWRNLGTIPKGPFSRALSVLHSLPSLTLHFSFTTPSVGLKVLVHVQAQKGDETDRNKSQTPRLFLRPERRAHSSCGHVRTYRIHVRHSIGIRV